MRHPIAGWTALLLVAALYKAIPAHAEGLCNPGDTLLGSTTTQTTRTDTCVKAPGPWSRGELDHAFSVWKGMPDTPAKAWVIKNITFKRDGAKTPVCVIGKDGAKICPPEMPSPWAGLNDEQAQLTFNGRFFRETPAVQKSLFAFESGKAFYLKLDIGSRFNAYEGAMSEMLAGVAPGINLGDRDEASMFGALFQVAMLQTPTEGHPGWQAPLKKLDDMLRRVTPP